jgi:REP element-mobilizing transposase RayT
MYNWKNRKRTRLKNYDYSQNWCYFVTICTDWRIDYFWEIISWEMIMNEFWEIIDKCFMSILEHFPNVELDEYIIMPNHIHWIIRINVGVENFQPLQKWKYWLSSIIKWFKIGVTKICKQNNINFLWWQRSFYDRIVRNEEEFYKIKEYIRNNPKKWDLDKNNQIH